MYSKLKINVRVIILYNARLGYKPYVCVCNVFKSFWYSYALCTRMHKTNVVVEKYFWNLFKHKFFKYWREKYLNSVTRKQLHGFYVNIIIIVFFFTSVNLIQDMVYVGSVGRKTIPRLTALKQITSLPSFKMYAYRVWPYDIRRILITYAL